MAGKRIYITLTQHEYLLLNWWGACTSQCVGMLSRQLVREAIYKELKRSEEMARFDARLLDEEREALLHGRNS